MALVSLCFVKLKEDLMFQQWVPGYPKAATAALQAMLGCLIAALALAAFPSLATSVNDTGITACLDAAGIATSCDDAALFPRQDARYGRDAQAAAFQLTKIGAGSKGFDYSKIAGDGSLLSPNASSWACTKDNVSGLTWEVKTIGGLRDQNATYSWYRTSGSVGTQSGGACQTGGRCDTAKYVADVNAVGLCGASDWRLPTVKELEGLADFGRVNQPPTIETPFFPNTAADLYWTSVLDSSTVGQYAWSIDFAGGAAYRNQLATAMRVRLVRGAATSSQFSLTDGGLTVTDSNTGLVWKRNYEMTDPARPGVWPSRVDAFNWSTALRRAVADRTGGYSDWRVPNVKELRSMIDETVDHPALNQSFFPPPLLASWFWSSSPTYDYRWFPLAWTVSLDFGHPLAQDPAQTNFVRLVRGGGNFDNLAVPAIPQTIGTLSFSGPLVAGNTTTVSAPGATPSGIPVVFSSNTISICTVGGTNGSTITGVSVGTCSITANQAGSATYLAAPPVTQSIAVGRGTQTIGTISFTPLTLAVSSTTTASATASSGLAVTFTSSTPLICTATGTNGSTINGVAAGTCTITANQAGNANYLAAPPVTENIAVKATQTIEEISLSPAILLVGSTTTASAVATPSGVPVLFSSGTPSICTVSGTNGSTITGISAGTCSINANQAGNANYVAALTRTQSIVVGRGSQSIGPISFSVPVVTGSTTAASAAASSSLAVTFSSITPSTCTATGTNGSTITGGSVGTCSITANQAGNANYLAAAAVTATIAIGQGAQAIGIISFTPSTLAVGTTTTASAPAATPSGIPVLFSSNTPLICSATGTNGITITGLAAGTCIVAASQAASANYFAAAEVVQGITVKAPQTIGALSFSAPLTAGNAITASAPGATPSGIPVVFSSNTPLICGATGANGSTITGVGVGTCSITANQAGNATYLAASAVTQTIAVGQGTQTIGAISFTPPILAVGGSTTTSAPGATPSGIAVTFSSNSPLICTTTGTNGSTVRGVALGNCSITANQAGNASYLAAAPVTQIIAVTPVLPVVLLSPGSLNFANQNVGMPSAAQTVTLSNTDVTTLTITSIVASGDFARTSACPATLGAGSSCTISVSFAPTAAGIRGGAITVTTNATGSPHSVSVTGTGVSSAPPVCTLTANPATVLPGQSSTLLASCSPAATSFSWSGGTCVGVTTSSCTVSPTVATSYSVTGTNSFGSSTASAEVLIREDLVYTPVTPCRIIDTRFPTPNILGPNSGRDFGISSSDYSAQGGQAGSCGIPANASAVAINVVSTGQSGVGHLRVIQSGVAVPNVAFLNYQPGVNLANAGIARVAAPSSTNGLFIYSGGSQSHAVVDIMGYFSAAASQAPINMEANPGALNLASPVVICQASLTPTQNWTARPSGSVSILADASGALNWASYFVYSTNAGASWSAASGNVMRGGAEASGWGYSSTNASDVVSLNAATQYVFGIRVYRVSGAGGVANSQCALSVGME